jgi:nucleotide-binding universal stress UspA family protein
VAARSACPVIVVGLFGARPPGADRPVVVGVDGSVGALAALDFGAAVAVAARAVLYVVCVAGNSLRVRDQAEGSPAGAAHLARVWVERARRAHPGLIARDVAVQGDVPGALSRHAGARALLVVGRRGSGARSPLVLGSVSRALLESGPSALAVVGGAVPGRTRPRTVVGQRIAPAEALVTGA